MFGSIGPTELILIFVIALLVFGPRKLPEIGKSVGKAIREFKKASDEIKGRIEEEIQASEIKDVGKDLRAGVESLRSEARGIADATGVTDLRKDLKSVTDIRHPVRALKQDVRKGLADGLKPEATAGLGPPASTDAPRPDLAAAAAVVPDPYADRAEKGPVLPEAGGVPGSSRQAEAASGAATGSDGSRPASAAPESKTVSGSESASPAPEPTPKAKPRARKPAAMKPAVAGLPIPGSETGAPVPKPVPRKTSGTRKRAAAGPKKTESAAAKGRPSRTSGKAPAAAQRKAAAARKGAAGAGNGSSASAGAAKQRETHERREGQKIS